MVKLVVEIKEVKKDKLCSSLYVGVTEIGKQSTEDEIYCSKLLKERMGFNKKEEKVNKITKSKEEILEELLKSLENL